MIVSLTGRLSHKGLDHVVLDVHGVGFSLAMSTGSLSALPAEGDEVTIFTHLHVREDELALFGFESAAEKDLFTKLITVSGVGPKVALASLSSFSPDVLASAIVAEDIAAVSSIPGIGKKTAQRIVLELKDRLAGFEGTTVGTTGASTGAGTGAGEARAALASMGFSAAETVVALKDYDGEPADVQAMLKHALTRLGGGV